ncbi:MAG: Gldg family protein, partial [Pseudobacter sp.]|uniref:Gldg family protein n=1 Tax=Pseudobacter sp. TaxID=2045420 RepID=UPI003F7DDAF8
GKYLSLVVFGLVMILILTVFSAYAATRIIHVDLPVICCGLLGLFLLICAYAAVGLFMSALTSYNVVAAIGTLAVLAALSSMNRIGQDMEFVRDITYWLSINGRAESFIRGLVTSEDLIYFIMVSGMFVSFTILKLQIARQKSNWLTNTGKYLAVVTITVMTSYISSMPVFMGYLDVTRNKSNTLTRASQEVVSKMKGGLTITSYTNMLEANYYSGLPHAYKPDQELFQRYIRFKPDIKFKYVRYYKEVENPYLDQAFPNVHGAERVDTMARLYDYDFEILPYEKIADRINLEPEGFRFVRQLKRENGQSTFLRIFEDMQKVPDEAEISAAFKRLVMKLPLVGFVSGHGERESGNNFDRGYKTIAQERTFRHSLINNGFDFTNISLLQPVPDSVNILVMADVKKLLTPEEKANFENYLSRGGNLLIAGEPGKQEFMNAITESLGVQFMEGMLVNPSKDHQQELILSSATPESATFSHYFAIMREKKLMLTTPTAGTLKLTTDKGFKVTTLFRTDTAGTWVEKETSNFVDDSAIFNPALETKDSLPLVMALSRKINDREQKILIAGDADWMSNAELRTSRQDIRPANFGLITAAFYWMSDGEAPVNMRRDPPLDENLDVTREGWAVAAILLKWIFPALLVITSLVIWIRRKGR